MHSPVAATPSQKGHSNPVEILTLTVTPCVNAVGNELVDDPDNGMFRLSKVRMITVIANRRTTKATMLNSGLL